MVLVRGVDLIMAVGTELRIASLSDVKARCGAREEGSTFGAGGEDEEVQLADYKVSSESLFTVNRRRELMVWWCDRS